MSRSLTPSQTQPQPTPENEGGGAGEGGGKKAGPNDSGQLEPGKIIIDPHRAITLYYLQIHQTTF